MLDIFTAFRYYIKKVSQRWHVWVWVMSHVMSKCFWSWLLYYLMEMRNLLVGKLISGELFHLFSRNIIDKLIDEVTDAEYWLEVGLFAAAFWIFLVAIIFTIYPIDTILLWKMACRSLSINFPFQFCYFFINVKENESSDWIWKVLHIRSDHIT